MHGALAWNGWGTGLEFMVRICRQTHVLVGVCYRRPAEVDEAFFRQLVEASHV